MRLKTKLGSERVLLNAFDRIYSKIFRSRRFYSLTYKGLSMQDLYREKKMFIKLLADELNQECYQLEPAQTVEAQLDKKRQLHVFGVPELILHQVASEELSERSAALLDENVFSYRKRKSIWSALDRFSTFIRKHLKETRDLKSRGLFVFRGDVKNYTDSIPTDEGSKLWILLKKLLPEIREGSYEWNLWKGLLAPMIHLKDGRIEKQSHGLPMGSPITTVMANLYLNQMDHALASISGAFYARYGDDLLFAHKDSLVTHDAICIIHEHLKDLGLSLNSSKAKQYYFNGAGRAPTDASSIHGLFQGTQVISFLGYQILFSGEIRLHDSKSKEFMDDFRFRIKDSANILKDFPLEKRVEALVSIVQQALDHKSPYATSYAHQVLRKINSRVQLKRFDYEIARMCSEAITGLWGPRTFRHLSYRRLREMGLPSLVLLRNGRDV